MSTAPAVAIVVSTRNRSREIRALLESLTMIETRDVEMVLVDQSDDDETAEVVEPYLRDARLRYVRSHEHGVSRGRNLGVSLTTAPVICITDDDCTVKKHWPQQMAAPFDDERIGVVWCSVLPGRVDGAGHTPHKVFTSDTVIREVSVAWRRAREGLNLGAGLAIRRTAYEAVGGFDESLGPGSRFPSSEDNDLAWRTLLNGWWVYELSSTHVVHDGYRTFAELRDLVRRDFVGVGGTCAKYLRAGQWGVLRLLVEWTYRFGIVDPMRDVVHGRRPRGFRRPLRLWEGVLEGCRLHIDDSIRFTPQ